MPVQKMKLREAGELHLFHLLQIAVLICFDVHKTLQVQGAYPFV